MQTTAIGAVKCTKLGPPLRAPAMASWRDHPLLRRLPFLLIAAGGIWLFAPGGESDPKLLRWRLPAERADWKSLEIELVDPEGHLLKREQFQFHAPPGPELEQKIAAPSGHYTAKIYIEPATLPAGVAWNRELREGAVTLDESGPRTLDIPSPAKGASR